MAKTFPPRSGFPMLDGTFGNVVGERRAGKKDEGRVRVASRGINIGGVLGKDAREAPKKAQGWGAFQ